MRNKNRISLGFMDPRGRVSGAAADPSEVSTSHYRVGPGMAPRRLQQMRPPPAGPIVGRGYTAQELSPGVRIMVKDGQQVAVQNVGSMERPIFAVVPLLGEDQEPEGAQPAFRIGTPLFRGPSGQSPAPRPIPRPGAKPAQPASRNGSRTPVRPVERVRQAVSNAAARAEAARRAQAVIDFLQSAIEGDEDADEDDGDDRDVARGMNVGDLIQTEDGKTLQVEGFDQCGAILTDSDGRRVFV